MKNPTKINVSGIYKISDKAPELYGIARSHRGDVLIKEDGWTAVQIDFNPGDVFVVISKELDRNVKTVMNGKTTDIKSAVAIHLCYHVSTGHFFKILPNARLDKYIEQVAE